MDKNQARLNETLMDFVDRTASLDPASDDAAKALSFVQGFSKIQLPYTEPAPEPVLVPETTATKVKATIARIMDNETTRTLIKAGGALAGVGLVAYTTIYKDHVLERQAIAQANQRSI